MPKDAVVIEIAPHALLQAILNRSLRPECLCIGLTKRSIFQYCFQLLESGFGFFYFDKIVVKVIFIIPICCLFYFRLYNAGLQPQIQNLYPAVSYPVARGTPMIQSLVEWNHSTKWTVAEFLQKVYPIKQTKLIIT